MFLAPRAFEYQFLVYELTRIELVEEAMDDDTGTQHHSCRVIARDVRVLKCFLFDIKSACVRRECWRIWVMW